MESTSSFNEDMPVDKILDAELAVEPKTETYTENSPGNSVRKRHLYLFINNLHSRCWLLWESNNSNTLSHSFSILSFHLVSFSRQMTQSLISAMQLTNNCLLWWSGPREYLISLICLWMIRSFCFEQVCDTHTNV